MNGKSTNGYNLTILDDCVLFLTILVHSCQDDISNLHV